MGCYEGLPERVALREYYSGSMRVSRRYLYMLLQELL